MSLSEPLRDFNDFLEVWKVQKHADNSHIWLEQTPQWIRVCYVFNSFGKHLDFLSLLDCKHQCKHKEADGTIMFPALGIEV